MRSINPKSGVPPLNSLEKPKQNFIDFLFYATSVRLDTEGKLKKEKEKNEILFFATLFILSKHERENQNTRMCGQERSLAALVLKFEYLSPI